MQLAGFAASDAEKQKALDDADRDRFSRAVRQALTGRAGMDVEFNWTRPDSGRPICLSARAVRLEDGDPPVQRLVGVLQERLDRSDIPAVSLRVGVPHYLGNAQHPKSSAALLRHLEHVLGLNAGNSDIDGEIEVVCEFCSADYHFRPDEFDEPHGHAH